MWYGKWVIDLEQQLPVVLGEGYPIPRGSIGTNALTDPWRTAAAACREGRKAREAPRRPITAERRRPKAERPR